MKKPTKADAKAAEEAEARRQAALTGENGSDGAETETDEDWNGDDSDNEGGDPGRDAPEGETWDGDDGESGQTPQPAHPEDESGTSLGGSSTTDAMSEDEAKAAAESREADAGPIQRVQIVQAPEATGGFTAGEALTPGQRAGLEPMDREKDNEQAQDRTHRTNMQTDHEADNGLDPTSSGPSPGVTPNVAYTAAATGAPPSDMSGRPPLAENDRKALDTARTALSGAKSQDEDKGEKEERQGWRTPFEIGVAGGVMARLQSIYPERIEYEEVPGGANFPETGRRYRLK